MRYNKTCPAHKHYCWTHRHMMREDGILCAKDYKRLPDNIRKHMSLIFKGVDKASNLSIIVDWCLDNPLEEDVQCTDKSGETT